MFARPRDPSRHLDRIPSHRPCSAAYPGDAAACPQEGGTAVPEVGFEPTTFRLRVGFSASAWSAPGGSGLLTLDPSSVQTASDSYRTIVWMIIGMIKAHPTKNRMPRQAMSY
jgi:hypothetical protein